MLLWNPKRLYITETNAINNEPRYNKQRSSQIHILWLTYGKIKEIHLFVQDKFSGFLLLQSSKKYGSFHQ